MTTTTGEASAHGYHKDQHEEQASSYTQYDGTRLGFLEHQLQEIALENCEGITVLDLGDGHGLRARHAIELGAKAVDRVDCYESEETSGRGNSVIHWFEGDVSKPDEIACLPLRYKEEGYDLVMANWLFHHVDNVKMLDGMCRSITAFLKPGGRLVGTRTFNRPKALAVKENVYGARYKDHIDVPGGMVYRYAITSDPLVEFGAGSMEATYKPAMMEKFHARYGLVDTRAEKYEEAGCVKKDSECWRLFLNTRAWLWCQQQRSRPDSYDHNNDGIIDDWVRNYVENMAGASCNFSI